MDNILRWRNFNDAPDQNPEAPEMDTETARQALLERLPEVLNYLFPAGIIRHQKFVIGDIHGNPGKSLSVELEGERRGIWHDFATGEGGDIFSLWAAARDMDAKLCFPEVLCDIGVWLALPSNPSKPAQQSPVRKQGGQPLDELGPVTHKWDYQDTDGNLIACVYRYDPPTGKEFRPWDVKTRRQKAPVPRPLYNQPQMKKARRVILVEGEKASEALIRQGIVATTAMNGAKAPVDKTDWSPLKGKHVIIWPDHDEAGKAYAEKAAHAVVEAGARTVAILTLPGNLPPKWDAADAVESGVDVQDFIEKNSNTEEDPLSGELDLSRWLACERFQGKPEPRKWLVEGVFPMAQPSLVAAAGGVGKSYLLLELAREIAHPPRHYVSTPTLFGGRPATSGTAVYITAEDDAIEVHQRLYALGTIPSNLYVVPLPDAGGTQPLFAADPATRAIGGTSQWQALARQLVQMPDLKTVIIDPLQPQCAVDLNVPENAQFVCSQLAWLAAKTRAAVIVSHHFAKKEVSTPEQAREAIRGSGGLVDGVRCCYALWQPTDSQAETIYKTLDIKPRRGGVAFGGVVKANGKANLAITRFVRDPHKGILVDRTDDIISKTDPEAELLADLTEAIAQGAKQGKPYTKTGVNGVYNRRSEMDTSLHSIGKHKLAEWLEQLLSEGKLVMAMAQGSTSVKYLDIPDGPVARGEGEFTTGYVKRNKNDKRRSIRQKKGG